MTAWHVTIGAIFGILVYQYLAACFGWWPWRRR